MNDARRHRASHTLLCALALFALNAYIALRLFQVEYHQHLGSVEGLFISITRFAMRNWGDLTWLPLWMLGMPFHHVYPPGIHVTAAALATLMQWSPAHAWHFLVAFLYCLGPPLLFWTAWRMSGRFGAAFSAGLLWSVFSPSCVLVPSIWHDTGEMISNRRLHNIVAWGEGPNAVMLGVAMLAIGLLHLAVTRRTRLLYAGAVLSVAALLASSWPSTMAFAIAVGCYLLAREPREWAGLIARIAAICAAAYAIVAPWIPPSTVARTFARTNVMVGAPRPEQAHARAIAAVILVALVAALWLVFRRFRLPSWFRFASFYFAVTGFITLVAMYGGPLLLTQSARFHLAMEIGFILTLVFGVSLLVQGRPHVRYVVAALLAIFALRQTIAARRFARIDIRSIPIESAIEYQEAKWFDAHMNGQRVAAAPSVAFWMNVFTDTPQLAGCCDQANTSWMNDVALYIVYSGQGAGNRQAEIRTLWLQTFGVHAFGLGGPHSREVYKSVLEPYALTKALPVAWRDNDDYICLIPARSGSIAHVMLPADLPPRLPANGIDIEPLRHYVNGLENAAYPLADVRWPNRHTMRLNASLTTNEIVSFQMTWWPGWSATANGRPVDVHEDIFGFPWIAPKCDGPCAIEMTWTGGAETRILWWLRLLALVGGIGFVFIRRKRQGR